MAAIVLDASPTTTAPAGRSTTRPAGPPWHRLAGASPIERPARRADAVYRRRRLAAVAVLVALAFLAGAALTLVVASPAGSSLTPEAVEAQRVTAVVEPGDTLWALARRLAPERDPREVVDALAEARGGTVLIPGEVVAWPPR